MDERRRGGGAERAEADLETQGIGWQDMPVAGGGGTQAMTVLRARVTSGNAPTAVQMLGFDALDWAKEGALADITPIAEEGGWGDVVPEALQFFTVYDGKWISAPVNVHSTNWVWANKAILDELGIAVPTTWDEFIAALDKVKASGKVALAHGGQPWQDATLFDMRDLRGEVVALDPVGVVQEVERVVDGQAEPCPPGDESLVDL